MWILPTYGRPDRCQQTLDSIMESGVSTPGRVIIDGDPNPAYENLILPENWDVFWFPDRWGVCATLNNALTIFPDEPWYGFISDDSIVRTPGWDKRLVEAAGPDGFANSADGFNSGNRMHGAVVFGGELLRAIGYWCPDELTHYFCDDVWERIGRNVGNWVYCPDVLVEHKHYLNGKVQKDETYKLAETSFETDKAKFNEWLNKDISPNYTAFDDAVNAAQSVLKRDLLELRRNRVKRSSVMICTPVYRDVSWQYTKSLVDSCLTMERFGTNHRCQMVIGNSNLPRARNELVAEFLASDCSDMLFIDSDMGWEPNDVLRLLSSEHGVIGGVGRKRCDAPNSDPAVWCAWFLGQDIEQDSFGAIKVGGVGTGFLKISRHVFESIIDSHPELKRHPLGHMSKEVGDNFYDFFKFGDGPNGECIGEDFAFCNRWRNLGGIVWIDPDIKLTHVGCHSYTGAVSEIFEPEVK